MLLLLTFWPALLPAGPARADYFGDRKAVAELRKANQEMEKTNQEQAVEAYRKFMEQRPDLDPFVAVDLAATMVDICYTRLKQTDKALQLCDWALDTYKGSRYAMGALTAKARILILEKRPTEAQELLEKEWDRVMAGGRDQVGPAVQQYVAALDAQGKRKEATAATRKVLAGNPQVFIDWLQGVPMGWMYERVLKDHLSRNELDAALGWGKLYFITCCYYPQELERVTAFLERIWKIKEMSDRSTRAFAEALRDPAKPNPLAEVKLPEVDVDALNTFVERPLGGPDNYAIINALLVLGRTREALVAAREWDGKYPGGDELIRRVLKATYLNVKVMEDFDAFRKTGQGPNPVDALVKKLTEDGEKKSEAQATPASGAKPAAPVANRQPLGYVKDTADDKRTLAGTGFAVSFERPAKASRVIKVRICATRTGTKAPAAKFHLYLLDEKMQVLADLPFSYEMIGQGAPRWYDLDVPAIEVPANFSIGLDFRPDAEKAIHVGLQRGAEQTHSFVGLPAKGYQRMAQPVEWMVRVVVE